MKESKISLGAGIGLIAGTIIGNVTNNIGLWIALGLCFGAGIGSVIISMFDSTNSFNQDLSFCVSTPNWTLPQPNFTNCNPN